MGTFRITLKAVAIAIVAFTPVLAHAQLDDRSVVSILRECRRVSDVSARTACYDNIPLGQEGDKAASAGAAGPPPHASAAAARGFGSDRLRQQAPARADEPDRISASLTASNMLMPGVYLLTLEDGAQWQFADAVPPSYEPPRRGSTVMIAAAALGSYLLTYDGQRAVRVRRVR